MDAKTKKKGIYGYALGSLYEAGTYAFINSFLLLFLTTVVKLDSTIAGTIVSVSMISEAIAATVFGRLSDCHTGPNGRRRPFIYKAGLALCVCFILSFTTINVPTGLKIVYYLLFGAAIKALYSASFTPHAALGAEITSDYDERTKIRSYCRLFSAVGNTVGYVLPLIVIEFMMNKGMAQSRAWSLFAIALAVFYAIPLYFCWKYTEPFDNGNIEHRTPDGKLPDVFKSYFELMKLKPMSAFLLMKVIFNFSYTFVTNSLAFYMMYKLNLSQTQTSLNYILVVVTGLIGIPVFAYLGVKLGKSTCLQTFMILSGVLGLGMHFLGVDTRFSVLVYVCIYSTCHAAFWQLSYPISYDICEADELCFGKRREGDVSSLHSLIPTIASAIAAKVLGGLLSGSGFDSNLAVQNAATQNMLESVFIVLPSILLILAGLSLFLYPLNRKMHHRLLAVLKDENPDIEEISVLRKAMKFGK